MTRRNLRQLIYLLLLLQLIAFPSGAYAEPNPATTDTLSFPLAGRPASEAMLAVMSGSDRFSIAWRQPVSGEPSELSVDANSTFYYKLDGEQIALLPSGESVKPSRSAAPAALASPSTLSIESDALISRDSANGWTYRLNDQRLIQPQSLQSDEIGNIYFQDDAGGWYSLDPKGRERFALRFEANPGVDTPSCLAAPSGDSVCMSRDLGIIGIREKSDAMRIFINGQEQFSARHPISVKGTTLVPLRGIFQNLGATVKWDSAKKTVTATKGKLKVSLVVNARQAKAGNRVIPLSQPAALINGSVYVPLRVVADALGATIIWEAPIKSIQIMTS